MDCQFSAKKKTTIPYLVQKKNPSEAPERAERSAKKKRKIPHRAEEREAEKEAHDEKEAPTKKKPLFLLWGEEKGEDASSEGKKRIAICKTTGIQVTKRGHESCRPGRRRRLREGARLGEGFLNRMHKKPSRQNVEKGSMEFCLREERGSKPFIRGE